MIILGKCIFKFEYNAAMYNFVAHAVPFRQNEAPKKRALVRPLTVSESKTLDQLTLKAHKYASQQLAAEQVSYMTCL